jgi:aryl-alcohol dehydrogenase-like predicted oxidoreductase
MEFYQVGNSGVRLSRIALGGHEYLPNGNSRGFNEDFQKAITPGYIFPGFGGEKRKALVKAAYDAGVNFFDVTHDSEKEALGRNLTEMPPPYPVYVQTRGELMNYSYDPGNKKMTDLGLLRAEVQRILKLMRRERLELLNLGILRGALDDPDFIAKITANVNALQKEGLILFAAADTFSGQETYKAMKRRLRDAQHQFQHCGRLSRARNISFRPQAEHACRRARSLHQRRPVPSRQGSRHWR